MVDSEFKNIHIDLEKGIFEINGCATNELPITKLLLEYDGTWNLSFTQELTGVCKKEPQ